MGDDYNILNSLKNSKSDTYKVPNAYFEELAVSVLLKIHSQNSTFTTPEAYFDSLADSILAKINNQEVRNDVYLEIKEFAPLLASLQQKQVYKVPNNYFNNLSINIPVSSKFKVVQLKTRFTFIKYAAAAVVIFVIALGGLFNYQQSQQSLAIYKQVKQINVEKSINLISDNDLNTIVDEEQLLAYHSTYTNTSLPWKNLDNLDEEMQYVSDEEIDAYFKENDISIN